MCRYKMKSPSIRDWSLIRVGRAVADGFESLFFIPTQREGHLNLCKNEKLWKGYITY